MQHWEIVNSGQGISSNTAVDLWNNACKYFKHCDDNPIVVKRTLTQGKGSGTKVEVEEPRPYSIKALCLHCNILEDYLHDVRKSRDKDNEYFVVVSKILYIIYVQLEEYAITGIFNPIFTAKRLNLDKEDTTTPAVITVNVVTQGIPELSNSENEILEKLESEIQVFENTKGKNPQRENDLDSPGFYTMHSSMD